MSKALDLLKQAKSVEQRADKYSVRIKTSLEIEMIQPLKEKIEKIEDKIFDLENFSLDTNLNKGQKLMTKEDYEDRFREIINLSYEKEMVSLELKAKEKAFNNLFGEPVAQS